MQNRDNSLKFSISSDIKNKFSAIYPSGKNLIIIRAPGRINLIGEHTDYNGGFVLPVALELQIIAAGSPRADKKINLYSENLNSFSTFSLEGKIAKDSSAPWSNYPRGVISLLKGRGFELKGMDIYYKSTIPLGSGLSSSAAIEIATAFLFQEYIRLNIDPLDMIELCQRAENDFVGVNCGIMDQFIVRLAKRGCALFLNCGDLSYEQVPFETEDVKVVVCNTMVERRLENSAYNERIKECREGVEKRIRHVNSENERVKKSVAFLKTGNFVAFGECMYKSHLSLRDDYEVSCRELDLMVELARGINGTIGARMTGAGFGGCTVNIVRSDAVNSFKKEIFGKYKEKTGLSAQIYASNIEEGVTRIE